MCCRLLAYIACMHVLRSYSDATPVQCAGLTQTEENLCLLTLQDYTSYTRVQCEHRVVKWLELTSCYRLAWLQLFLLCYDHRLWRQENTGGKRHNFSFIYLFKITVSVQFAYSAIRVFAYLTFDHVIQFIVDCSLWVNLM